MSVRSLISIGMKPGAAMSKHLPGRHDQKSHGNRGGIVLLPGSLGLSRSEMPQIPGRFQATFVRELRAEGTSVETISVDPSTLRPVQARINRTKVARAKRGILANVTKLTEIKSTISSDNFILDGHHRWVAYIELGREMPVLQVDLNIQALLKRTAEFNEKHGVEAKVIKHLAGQHDQSTHGNWARGGTLRIETSDFGGFFVMEGDKTLDMGRSLTEANLLLDIIRGRRERGLALEKETGFNPFLDKPPPKIMAAMEMDPDEILRDGIKAWKGNPGSVGSEMADLKESATFAAPTRNANVFRYDRRNQARILLDAIEDAPVVPFHIYRGQDTFPKDLLRAGDTKLDVGDEFEWFWAGGTPDRQSAIDFAGRGVPEVGSTGFLFEIQPGARALAIDRVKNSVGGDLSSFADEDEHLVSGTFRVKGVRVETITPRKTAFSNISPVPVTVVRIEQIEHFVKAELLRKHMGPGDHPSGSPQSAHGRGKSVASASGKKRGAIFDSTSAGAETASELGEMQGTRPGEHGSFMSPARDIFDATLVLPDQGGGFPTEFKSEVTDAFIQTLGGKDDSFNTLIVEGVITAQVPPEFDEFGEALEPFQLEVGKFRRRFLEDGVTVLNAEFNIDPEFQGRGIGTMFISHWEDEMAAAGLERITLSTADVGNYAWAIAGYEFDSFQHEVMEQAVSMVGAYDHNPTQVLASFAEDTKSWETLRMWTDEFTQVQLIPRPIDLALIGADRPRGDTHFGKELMLSLPSWGGAKDIKIKKSLGPARAIWKEWARTNPAGIEQDDPEFLKELAAAIKLQKHLPGQHNQLTHGRRTGKVSSATGKLSGIITDPSPVTEGLSGLNKPFDIAYDVFEATLELPDGTKVFAEVRDVHEVGGNLKVFGIFTTNDGGVQIGGFTRIFKPGDAVYNADLKISEDFQGRGIGTMFLSHWEDELAAAGIKEMTVASVDVGRYAWAVSGYDWRGQQEFWKEKAQIVFDLHDADFSQSSSIGSMAKYQGDAQSWSTLGTLLKKWDDAALFTRRPDSQVPTPLDFALIGSARPVGDSHFGKDLFLQGPPWSGKKKLLTKSLAEARAIWKRWAQSNPAAIETDDPEFLAEMSSAVKVEKHLPGQHDQKSHGNWARGGGLLQDLLREIADFSTQRHKGPSPFSRPEAIVLEHGREYTAPATTEANQALMEEFSVDQGEFKDCFQNACSHAVFESDRDHVLTYVEGFALSSTFPMAIHHGWLVTPDGQVVDPTWGQEDLSPGVEYFGIPFDKTWLSVRMLKTKVWGVFQGSPVEDIEDAIAT